MGVRVGSTPSDKLPGTNVDALPIVNLVILEGLCKPFQISCGGYLLDAVGEVNVRYLE
jgi:hypothetical protein